PALIGRSARQPHDAVSPVTCHPIIQAKRIVRRSRASHPREKQVSGLWYISGKRKICAACSAGFSGGVAA
ncbi:hypothetical protein, partial [Cronobacter sakazakii]|uniref:hypothetical protein n=1 Tax=Cronobacter sakazakii TaxID=28141 RepID=UPI00294AC825